MLDNVVLDVTQMSYQSLVSIHQAQTVCNAIYSANQAHSVIEENEADSVNRAHSVNEGNVKDSVNRAHSVIKGKLVKSVFIELTRSSQETQCLPSSLGD